MTRRQILKAAVAGIVAGVTSFFKSQVPVLQESTIICGDWDEVGNVKRYTLIYAGSRVDEYGYTLHVYKPVGEDGRVAHQS